LFNRVMCLLYLRGLGAVAIIGQWRIQKFWNGGGKQYISSVINYRKCTQRTIVPLMQEKAAYWQIFWANGGPPPFPLESAPDHRWSSWYCYTDNAELNVSYSTRNADNVYTHTHTLTLSLSLSLDFAL